MRLRSHENRVGVWVLIAMGTAIALGSWTRPARAGSGPEPLNPVGACLIGSGCVFETESMCTDAGGTWLGDGTSCDFLVTLQEPAQNGGLAAVADPVYLFSGELYQQVVDLRVRGRGPDFAWGRKYRSRIGGSHGIGHGWDFSYDIRLLQLANAPGEVPGLSFAPDKQTLSWPPPADPGGPVVSLRYCALRSTQPSNFASLATTTFVEMDSKDNHAIDPATPPPGGLFSYLVSAKNLHGESNVGTRSDGTPRQALPCGAAGPDLVLFDGTGRQDEFEARPSGTWQASEHFEVFTRNPDGSFTLRFPDTASWSFLPFDGSPSQGEISTLADRNGNALHFSYDPAGRLSTVTDTLGRAASIVWNAQGSIASVTDFTGRQVRYDYYDGLEPGGSLGDLKRVTTPAVTGTPTGNDFPFGKTTLYTYSTGFFDDRLNHNLLTVTDSRGQTYLVNEYDPATDPLDLGFDRLRRQTWGDPGDIIDFVYTEQVPGPANGEAVLKAVVNDRVGNVSEYLFDRRNRCTMRRDHTGRANPDLPTDLDHGLNPPVFPLRPDDPPYFETRYVWNDDALPVSITYPDLDSETSVYDEANPNRRSQGNRLLHCRQPGPLGGDQLQICESFEYNPLVNHDTNLATRIVDGRGGETLQEFDLHGNHTRTRHRIPSIVEDFEYNAFGQLTAHVLPDNGSGSRRRDEFTYYTSVPQTGYPRQEIVDAPNLALTMTYEHDARGNVTRRIDPRGHDSIFVYNQLDQVVRSTSREIVSGVRYQEDILYDANDNVIRTDVSNVDDQNVLQPNAAYSQIYEYDILDEVTRACSEAGDVALSPSVLSCAAIPPIDLAQFVVTGYEYDANRQRTRVVKGEASNGHQPENVVATEYDERGLVYREIRAPGSALQSTTQFDYDGDLGVRRVAAGLESSPRVEASVNDGYGRLLRRTDPMGNVLELHHDPNNNLTSWLRRGELIDGPGGVMNVRLGEGTFVYDAMDRPTRTETNFFDPTNQAPFPGGQQPGKAITSAEYSDASQILRVVNDNTHDLRFTYDTANREKTSTDALGNRVTSTYDANANVTVTTELEKSDLGSPDATYTTNYSYDNLDRMTLRTDAIGNATNYRYDSRGNLTLVTDALGRQKRFAFDGLGRRVRTVRDMNGNGASAADPADIVTSESWDASSRAVSRTDDNGSATLYDYDPLDRRTVTTFPDGTQETSAYDVHDNRTTLFDPNGSFISHTYDQNDRLTGRTISPGPGVSSDTTFETFQYDGASRLIRAEDNDSVLTYAYDSLSNTRGETVLGRTTASVYDGLGNRTSCTYPGGRTITTTYDALERMKTTSDGLGVLASYFYRGPRRVERRDYRNGTRTSYTYDGVLPNPAGDFGRRKLVRTTHTKVVGGTILDDRSYTWDRVMNKTRRSDLRTTGPRLTHDLSYDAAYRLAQVAVTAPGPVPVRTTSYTFDGVENRVSVTGPPDPGLYVLDSSTPEPADAAMNQYSSTPFDDRQYDKNGNLTTITLHGGPTTNLLYDYRNQMVDDFDGGTGQHHVFRYDALGRRIVKITDVSGAGTEIRYFRDGRHVIEEENNVGSTLATYVLGRAIDEPLNMERGGIQYFYHTDDLSNVVALTNAAGNVVERYDYQDWGVPEFRDVSGNVVLPITQSSVGNPFLFQGRRYDPETGWYCHRARYRDPRSGEWTTRDVLGTWGDEANLGDANAFVGNNPWTHTDPFGMQKKDADPEPTTEAEKALAKAKEEFEAAKTAKKTAEDTLAQAKRDDCSSNETTRKALANAIQAVKDAETTRLEKEKAVAKAEEDLSDERIQTIPGDIEKLDKDFEDLVGAGPKEDTTATNEDSIKYGRQAYESFKKWKEARAKGKKGKPPTAKDKAEEVRNLERWKKSIQAGIDHLSENEDHKTHREKVKDKDKVFTGHEDQEKPKDSDTKTEPKAEPKKSQK